MFYFYLSLSSMRIGSTLSYWTLLYILLFISESFYYLRILMCRICLSIIYVLFVFFSLPSLPYLFSLVPHHPLTIKLIMLSLPTLSILISLSPILIGLFHRLLLLFYQEPFSLFSINLITIYLFLSDFELCLFTTILYIFSSRFAISAMTMMLICLLESLLNRF